MTKKLNTTIYFKQARIMVFLLALLLVGAGQLAAQQTPTVTITTTETFDSYGFDPLVDYFILNKPTNPGLEFLDNIDFDYNTTADGQMANTPGECIITINSDRVGHGPVGQWPHPDHTGGGFYLFAVSPAGEQVNKTIYYTTVAATKGETITFDAWIKNVDTGYNMRIDAIGTALGTQTSGMFSSSEADWTNYTLTITATATENITFKVIDMYGYGNAQHKFGIDDISVSVTKKALNITAPTVLVTRTTVGTSVPLQIEYNNPSQAAVYRWEKSEDGATWNTVSGTQTTTAENIFTADHSATELNEKEVYYRLAVSYDNFANVAFYSDVLTIEFRSSDSEYIFKEDFGGNWVSIASLDQGITPASGDWWVMPDNEPSITTDFVYGEPDTHNGDNRPKAEIAFGQRPVKLDYGGEARYAITKLAGYHIPIPGYSGDEWKWGDHNPDNKGPFYDHTIPSKATQGYFMYAANRTSSPKAVYEATVLVTPKTGYAFSAWQVAIWGKDDVLPYQFKLEVFDNSGTVLINSAEFDVSDDWEERKLLFYIPSSYSGSNVKIRVSSLGDNLWLGLDDISVREYDTYANITSPQTGSEVGISVDFTVDYQYAGSSIKYIWQKSKEEDSGWTDIAASIGTAPSSNGKFTTRIAPIEDGYYYRVLVTDGGNADDYKTDAIDSEPVQLYRGNYIFKEDFGGTTQSTGTSGDWWITESEALAANLKGLYNSDYQYAPDASWFTPGDIANHPYGMDKTLYLYNDRFAITKVSGKMTELDYSVEPNKTVAITYEKTLFDHTSGNGTGYYMMSRGWNADKILYSHTQNCLPAGNYSFNVWLAGTSTEAKNKVNLTLKVKVGEKTFIETVKITTQDWTEYSVPFYTDGTPAEISIISDGNYSGHATFGVDDISITDLRPRITKPNVSEVNVINGESIILEGEYKYVSTLGSTVTYKWEKSDDGKNWTPTNISGGPVPNTDNTGNVTITSTCPTDPIALTTYYRFVVEGNGITLDSKLVKIIPVDWPKNKTYWVCPDNMTDGQMDATGYRPSLVYLDVPNVYTLTYKWYGSKTGSDEFDNLDYYDPTANDDSMLSDNLSYTFSALNERNTSGVFNDRTYWVEMCDADGNAKDNVERIPIYLKQAYICASLEPKVSKESAQLINRENFGGTDPTDDDVLQTPPTNINIDYNQYTEADETLPEGAYMITKVTPTLPDGDNNPSWYDMKDHIYGYDGANDADDKHGYLVAVNATEEAGRLYTYKLTNLGTCRNIELVFSGWFASPVNWNGTEKANLKFILTNSDTGEIMSEFITGNLLDQDGGRWRQFGFKFYVPDGVTSIDLEVRNNNFGTRGGNDVVMDDIEIYIAMPPVSLTTLTPGVVCGDPYGTLVLEGEYIDDGTLSRNLDYRWEYSNDGGFTWTPIADADAKGSSTNGVISNEDSKYLIYPFTQVETGDYRLVVGQVGAFVEPVNYACMAVSEPYSVSFAATGEDYPKPVLRGKTAFCYNDIAVINNEDENATSYGSYSWLINGMKIQDNTDAGASPEKLELPLDNYTPGYHTISLQAKSPIHGCTEISIHNILIYPKEAIWTAQGDTHSWNDNRNWDTNVIPGECTDVIIPYDAINMTGTTLLGHYPLLKKPTEETLNKTLSDTPDWYEKNQENVDLQKKGQNDDSFSLRPACDNIHFKMGGAVARTDYLKYTSANVDLDLKPDRWYTLSAPLQSMYSGDYYVEGNEKRRNPIVYMMKYNSENPQTGNNPAIATTGDFSNPFNTLTEDLYPGLGFAVWVDDEKADDALNRALQPFRFPRIEEKYEMWNYYGHSMGEVSIPSRNNSNRFTYEQCVAINPNGNGYNGTTEKEVFTVKVKEDEDTYTTMLVGNPFMAHLDFSAFATKNSIVGGYYVWTSGNTYTALLPGDFSNDPNEIAPMQSFIVPKSGTVNELTFTFDMAIAAPDPESSTGGGVLRSASSSEKTILQMDVLRDSVIHSNVRIAYNPSASNAYDARKDMWTLFSETTTYPAVLYALVDGKAASIRTIGDLSKPIELGIRTTVTGLLTLQMSGLETLDMEHDLYLEDRLTGVIQNLRENSEYTFDNQTGNVQGRLFLRTDDGSDDDEDAQGDSNIHIFANGKQIRINSAPNDPIETIKVYSSQGNALVEKRSLNQSSFSLDLPVHPQVIIVSVTTRTQQKTEKLLIR